MINIIIQYRILARTPTTLLTLYHSGRLLPNDFRSLVDDNDRICKFTMTSSRSIELIQLLKLQSPIKHGKLRRIFSLRRLIQIEYLS